MSDLKRNLQYLKSLKTQREQLRTQLIELDAQIAHLRKNPTDKLTNDLVLYSNNKKKELLKEEISSIDKEIYKINNGVEQNSPEEINLLTESEKQEYYEELTEIFPEPEEVKQPIQDLSVKDEALPIREEVASPKTEKVFSKLLKGYKNLPAIIICSAISVALLWSLFVWDVSNLIGYFAKVTRVNFFSFIILGAFAFTVITTSAYKGISTKNFGAVSDYFMLIMFICALGVFGLYIKLQTTFKLVVFALLATYCLIYYVLRLNLYQKDTVALTEKNRFLKYYRNLFSKVSPSIILLSTTTFFVLLYVTMATKLFRRWLSYSNVLKPIIIISIVLLALSYLYLSAFSIVRINEPNIYAIDIFIILSEAVALEYFVISKFISANPTVASNVIVVLTFVFALGLNVYRIIKIKK